MAAEKTVRWRSSALQQGWTMVPNAVLDAPISPGAFRLWCILADYARQDESCFAGQTTLAERLQTTTRTIRAWRAELVEVGLLENIQRGLGKTNEYVLTLPGEPCSEAETRAVRQPTSEPSKEEEDALEEDKTLSPASPSKEERDTVWNALEAVFGKPTTPQHRKRFGKVQKELLADTSLAAAAVAAEVPLRAARYRAKWPDCELTLEALAKHWPDLRGNGATLAPSWIVLDSEGVPVELLSQEDYREWRRTASPMENATYQQRFDVADDGLPA